MKKIFLKEMALGLLLFPLLCSGQQANWKGDRMFFYCAEYCTFSGFYLGGNLGWIWGSYHTSFESPGFDAPVISPNFDFDTSKNTITGGGQGGFNYHHNHLLAGIEVDYNTVRLGNEVVVPASFDSQVFDGGDTFNVNNGGQVSYRARLGYVYYNWLYYGTLGFSQIDFNVEANLVGAGKESQKERLNGGTVGFGTEYAFNRYWSVALEYRFSRYAGKNIDINDLVTSVGSATSLVRANVSDVDIHQALAKVNFRIG